MYNYGCKQLEVSCTKCVTTEAHLTDPVKVSEQFLSYHQAVVFKIGQGSKVDVN